MPKIMHQNLAVILRQFNYSKNSFIVLVPGRPNSKTFTECCDCAASKFLVCYKRNLPLGPILLK